MVEGTTRQRVMFPELFEKKLVAQFDQPHGSSDGGAVLLKACDERLQLTARIAACFRDQRQPGKVMHTLHDLIRQRVFLNRRAPTLNGRSGSRATDIRANHLSVPRWPVRDVTEIERPSLPRETP